MKIGLVGKDNYKGLGVLTDEYMGHFNIHRLMCVSSPRRQYEGAMYVDDIVANVDKFIDGLDLVIVLEYSPVGLFKACQERNIPCILKVNFEFLPTNLKYLPSVFLCSSTLNYDSVPYENKVLLQDPVNTEIIPFKQRKRVKTLLHNAGTLGLCGANCTEQVIDAMRFVDSDISLIVNSQKNIDIKLPKNVTFNYRRAENYWDLWGEGDLFVMPQKFRATSLPIQEAMANGMPVLTTNRPPFSEFCELLVDPYHVTVIKEYIDISMFHVKPSDIAKKIDEIAQMDITEHSKRAREYAESISWKALLPKYLDLFASLVDKKY